MEERKTKKKYVENFFKENIYSLINKLWINNKTQHVILEKLYQITQY